MTGAEPATAPPPPRRSVRFLRTIGVGTLVAAIYGSVVVGAAMAAGPVLAAATAVLATWPLARLARRLAPGHAGSALVLPVIVMIVLAALFGHDWQLASQGDLVEVLPDRPPAREAFAYAFPGARVDVARQAMIARRGTTPAARPARGSPTITRAVAAPIVHAAGGDRPLGWAVCSANNVGNELTATSRKALQACQRAWSRELVTGVRLGAGDVPAGREAAEAAAKAHGLPLDESAPLVTWTDAIEGGATATLRMPALVLAALHLFWIAFMAWFIPRHREDERRRQAEARSKTEATARRHDETAQRRVRAFELELAALLEAGEVADPSAAIAHIARNAALVDVGEVVARIFERVAPERRIDLLRAHQEPAVGPWTREALGDLRPAELLGRLTRVSLARSGADTGVVGGRGLETLLAALAAATLTSLDLRGHEVGVSGLRALAASPHARTLERLDVSDQGFGRDMATVLCDEPFPALARLKVDRVADDVVARLRARFGAGLVVSDRAPRRTEADLVRRTAIGQQDRKLDAVPAIGRFYRFEADENPRDPPHCLHDGDALREAVAPLDTATLLETAFGATFERRVTALRGLRSRARALDETDLCWLRELRVRLGDVVVELPSSGTPHERIALADEVDAVLRRAELDGAR